MSVVVAVQDVGPWRKQVTVEVPAPAVEAETQRVVREYAQRVRVPGFRRGKVPSDLVRRRFAKEIEHEVVDRLLPRYWRQAQAEAELDPLMPPEVDEVRDVESGGPLTFVATVETRPRIELRNVHDFNIPNPDVEPGEMDVEKALDDLRMRFGEWVPVTRAAARGDLVHTQITELPDDAAAGAAADSADAIDSKAAAPAPQPVEFEVGDARVWEDLSLAVTGVEAGQETTFVHEPAPGEVTAPAAPAAGADAADAPDVAAVATPARRRRFKVKVDAVKQRELPALDDDLAARVNPELGGLSALRDLVVQRLREGRTQERNDHRRATLLQQLRERHPLELPQGVVEHEVEHMARDYADNLARRGLRAEQAGIDWQEIRQQIRPLAEQRVHDRLLLDAVAAAEAVAVTDEEFERALATLARAQQTTTPALRRALDEDGRLESLRNQMRRDKTTRHLLGELPAAGQAGDEAAAAGVHAHGGHGSHGADAGEPGAAAAPDTV
jgi:trigger factor